MRVHEDRAVKYVLSLHSPMRRRDIVYRDHGRCCAKSTGAQRIEAGCEVHAGATTGATGVRKEIPESVGGIVGGISCEATLSP